MLCLCSTWYVLNDYAEAGAVTWNRLLLPSVCQLYVRNAMKTAIHVICARKLTNNAPPATPPLS
jgi:hypothetical protein